MNAMRGRIESRWLAFLMSPPRTSTTPSWIRFAPATMPSSVDLPTPSGPIRATMAAPGRSSETASMAATLPYRCPRQARRATGAAAMSGLSLQALRPGRLRIEPDIGNARQATCHRSGVPFRAIGVDSHANTKHQLVALALGLDHLWRELSLRSNERHPG